MPCCFEDGTCAIFTEAHCLEWGGTWHPEEPDCDPNFCPQPVSACCFDGYCLDLTEQECSDQGGDWYQEVLCDPNPCPVPLDEERVTWGSIKAMYRK
jgi:hypothetical protein